MHTIHRASTYSRAFVSGFLIVFAVGIVAEFFGDWLMLLIALFVIAAALKLAQYAAKHFHGAHTHVGDSAIDIVAIGALLLANVLHPMVDGFSFYETAAASSAAGAVLGISILGHEVLRQWALIEAVREHVRRPAALIIPTAILGIGAGIALGAFGTAVTEGHERIADLATIFAYAFIIGEFYVAGHGHATKKAFWLVALGVLIGIFFTFLL